MQIEKLREIAARRPYCGDSACLFRKRGQGGQCTNGGCMCGTGRQGLWALKNYAAKMAQHWEKLLDVAKAAKASIGLMCKYGGHADDGCKDCAVSVALAALEAEE